MPLLLGASPRAPRWQDRSPVSGETAKSANLACGIGVSPIRGLSAWDLLPVGKGSAAIAYGTDALLLGAFNPSPTCRERAAANFDPGVDASKATSTAIRQAHSTMNVDCKNLPHLGDCYPPFGGGYLRDVCTADRILNHKVTRSKDASNGFDPSRLIGNT